MHEGAAQLACGEVGKAGAQEKRWERLTLHRRKCCLSSPCPASHRCASPATDRLCRCVVSCARGVSPPFPLWRRFRPQCRTGETERLRHVGRVGAENEGDRAERRGRDGGESAPRTRVTVRRGREKSSETERRGRGSERKTVALMFKAATCVRSRWTKQPWWHPVESQSAVWRRSEPSKARAYRWPDA